MRALPLPLPVILLPLLLLSGCAGGAMSPEELARSKAEAEVTLKALHRAAAAAVERDYFNLFADDAVFLGTDASERWTKKQFQAYARPHFQKGQGWNYRASERNVRVDPKGEYAWFDELLTNRKLGQCRGSGLLRRVEGEWKVVLYDLSIPIPNELAEEVVEKIKARETPKSE